MDWQPTIITDFTPGVGSGMADAAAILKWPIYGYTAITPAPHPNLNCSTAPDLENLRSANIALYIGALEEPTPSQWLRTLPLLANQPLLASTINWSEVVNYWEECQRWDTVYAIRYSIHHAPECWTDRPTIHVSGPTYSNLQWANTVHEQTREWFLWVAKRIIGQLTCPDMEPETRRRFGATNV